MIQGNTHTHTHTHTHTRVQQVTDMRSVVQVLHANMPEAIYDFSGHLCGIVLHQETCARAHSQIYIRKPAPVPTAKYRRQGAVGKLRSSLQATIWVMTSLRFLKNRSTSTKATNLV